MTSPVDIANLALSAVGTRSTISSFSEGSPEAVACAQWYDTTRQQIMRMARWGCARTIQNLALIRAAQGTPENPNVTWQGPGWDPSQPPPGWYYQYAYPDDCQLAMYVVPAPQNNLAGVPIFPTNTFSAQSSVFGPPVKSIVVRGQDLNGNWIKTICTNQQNATLNYIADVTDCNQWDQGLSQSIIYGLAAAIAQTLTGDKTLAAKLAKLANDNVLQARVMNANENMATQDVIPDWIKARGVTYGWDGYSYQLDQFGPLFPQIT